jgi:hypothetical protein
MTESRPSREADAAVGQPCVPESGVVDALVMEVTHRDRVGQVAATEFCPGSSVVELAPGEGTLAAVGCARGVGQPERQALMV